MKETLNAFFIMKLLLISYAITGIVLLILAFIMYKAEPTAAVVSAGIIFSYIFSSFIGGFLLGKKMKEKKYLWGILFGVLYFIVVFIVSLIMNKEIFSEMGNTVSVFIMCTLSSMIGGMIS